MTYMGRPIPKLGSFLLFYENPRFQSFPTLESTDLNFFINYFKFTITD